MKNLILIAAVVLSTIAPAIAQQRKIAIPPACAALTGKSEKFYIGCACALTEAYGNITPRGGYQYPNAGVNAFGTCMTRNGVS